jgi:molybdopterin molybdotransferase
MLDRSEVPVYKKPRVAIVATGDELRAPGSIGAPGSIPESNFLPLKVLLERAGAELTSHTIARDEKRGLRTALADALASSDLLVTIGGVSVGDHDLVRPALDELKVDEVFWKVAMKPGKPVYYGRSGEQHVLGVPGNPASAQITFALFGVPLLRALQGAHSPFAVGVSARLAHPLRRKGGRREFYRAKLDGGAVRLMSNQASGAPSMAWANPLVDVPADCETLQEGECVTTLPIALL